MDTSVIDYSDVQGLIRFGYAHLQEACFLLLRVEHAAAARAWLATVAVTTAERLAVRPDTALQIAFTCEGLQALGVPAAIMQGFSPEFIAGMTGEDSRSRRLGDIGASAPAQWQWGHPGNVPHALLMLYARKGLLHDWQTTVTRMLSEAGWQLLRRLDTAELDGYEPFGFKDGISEPQIDWQWERQADSADQLIYGNLVAVGEFLFGYPNEYGQYTDRPLVHPSDDPHAHLFPAEDQPHRRDLGRNGSYLVLRHLQQDVPGFWQFLDEQAHGDATERQTLAASMVGRTQEGAPFVPLTERPIAGVDQEDPDDRSFNQFTYALDTAGVRCPFGAHIRRVNPRNADLPEDTQGLFSYLLRILGFNRQSIRDDTIASTRFHRLLRRGRKYGTGLSPEEAIQRGQPDDDERGLYFICLNANIGRQFEFVQDAWLMGTKFNGLTEESDPLLGNREPIPGCPITNTFSLPRQNGVRRRIVAMPQFVTVRGGAYFFLPSVRALRYMASLGH